MPGITSHDPLVDAYVPSTEVFPAMIAVCWPDLRPCHEVEMFMLDQGERYTARELDGGSLRVIASQLSPLIRFCWSKKISFREMDDGLMAEAVKFLMSEEDPHRFGKTRRQNNTTIRIIATWIDFFRWMQSRLVQERKIVGPKDQNPQIPLIEKKITDRRGNVRTVWTYRLTPPPSTPENVRGPISRVLRQKLWEGAAAMSNPDERDARYKGRFLTLNNYAEECEFLLKRRQLLLDLLEASGARPGELARMLAHEHRCCSEDRRLKLPTLKRRKLVDPVRSVPVNAATAIRIELYIKKYRQPLLKRLRAQGLRPKPRDCLLLTVQGFPVTEALLEKEFRRIVAHVGLEQERACMSMFRHRFITNLVKLHLLSFMDEHPGKGRFSMAKGDYRTVLTRVLPFTNHADIDSLFFYIDLAWDELGVFAYAEPARLLGMTVEQALNRLTALAASVRSRSEKMRDAVLDEVLIELQRIRGDVADALECMSRTGL
ncbi:Phage integrase family protein [Burkholderia sp. YR290]|nr:Phage integrase family protein [Burkholderia sp. YR290]